jgi:hypothetical protein
MEIMCPTVTMLMFSGRHPIVNGCEFMDEGKRAVVLEKGNRLGMHTPR